MNEINRKSRSLRNRLFINFWGGEKSMQRLMSIRTNTRRRNRIILMVHNVKQKRLSIARWGCGKRWNIKEALIREVERRRPGLTALAGGLVAINEKFFEESGKSCTTFFTFRANVSKRGTYCGRWRWNFLQIRVGRSTNWRMSVSPSMTEDLNL